jgi:signal-transduction protein with cAMP-binding, CBS, and nucleotidyltransferase domain
LSEQEFNFLTSHLVQRKYGAGELIFGEGDPYAGLYVVRSGNVRYASLKITPFCEQAHILQKQLVVLNGNPHS